jgi:hypothetical protein
MEIKQLVVTAMILGTLVSLFGMGKRGYHFFPSFIILTLVVIGVGMLVNWGFKHFKDKEKRD